MPLNCGSVLKLEPMLNPLVASSSVMGDTPVMNIRLGAVGGEYGVGKVVVLIDNKVEVEF